MLSNMFFISTNINFKLMPISRLFLFLFAISHLKFQAQDNKINNISYDNYVWAANIDLVNGDYKNCYKRFYKAFKFKKPESAEDSFNSAVCALEQKKNRAAENLIREGIILHNPPLSYFLNYKHFKSHNEIKHVIEKDYDDLVKKFYKNIKNPVQYERIKELIARDQMIRTIPQKFLAEGAINYVDSLNGIDLIAITKEYGWQDRSHILLWHHRGEDFKNGEGIWSFFKPYINELIEMGKLKKSYFAIYEDEISITKNKKQIYGLYFMQFGAYPIKDIKNVDKRRENIGLPPLYYMKKVYGIELPDEYKINIKKFYEQIYSKAPL